MKRAFDHAFPVVPPSPALEWSEFLVEDVRGVLYGMLDPVSLVALALTSKGTLQDTRTVRNKRCNIRATPWGFASQLISHGYDELAARILPIELLCSDEIPPSVLHYGALACLKRIHREGSYFDFRYNTWLFAYHGHPRCLEYLLSIGCPWEKGTSNIAAEMGRVECLRVAYAHQKGFGCGAMYAAARKGQLECLVFAHTHGEALPADIVHVCAASGQLATLRYVVEQGPEFNASVLWCAIYGGSVECLKYLLEQPREVPWSTTDLREAAHDYHASSYQDIINCIDEYERSL